MQEKIAIVIVTYNRLDLLRECLSCVKNQQLAPSAVVVINNHSTDGTEEYLNQLPDRDDQRWVIYTEDQNIGGSGGFYDGMRFAMKTEVDWILLIDDDAMLAPDYLKKISKSISEHPDVMAFSGSVVTNGKYMLDHRRRFNKIEIPVPVDEYNQEEFEYDLSSFCGVVVKRDLVEKIGYPERDFFIWYDDTEYSLRIRKVSRLINVNSAVLNHKTRLNEDDHCYRKLNWKYYYGYRNIVYSYKKHGMYFELFRYRIYRWLKSAYFNYFNKNCDRNISKYNLRLIWNSISDGLRGKLGKSETYKP